MTTDSGACRSQFVRRWLHLCTIGGHSWFPAAGLMLLWGKAFSFQWIPHLRWPRRCLCFSTQPRRSSIPISPRSFRRTLMNSSLSLFVRSLNTFLQESVQRMGRGKRAKGSRILNHTLYVSQPDVQRESCGTILQTFFRFEGPFPWCIRNP